MSGEPRLALVAGESSGDLLGGHLLAAIRFWPVRVGTLPVLLLGPIAVHPTAQGEGFGAILMRDSLARARELAQEGLGLGHEPVADVEVQLPQVLLQGRGLDLGRLAREGEVHRELIAHLGGQDVHADGARVGLQFVVARLERCLGRPVVGHPLQLTVADV